MLENPTFQRPTFRKGSRLFSSLLNWVCPNGNKSSPDWFFIVDLNPKRRIPVFFRGFFYKKNPEFQGRLFFFMVGLTYRVTSDWFRLKIGDHRRKKSRAGMMSFLRRKKRKKKMYVDFLKFVEWNISLYSRHFDLIASICWLRGDFPTQKTHRAKATHQG